MKYYRKICNIFWPRKISHRDLYEKTGCHSVVMEIKTHRIRTSQEHIPHKAQRWKPPGKRMLGRPETTWWRAVKTEFREMALTWGEDGKKAKKNIDRRRRLVQTAKLMKSCMKLGIVKSLIHVNAPSNVYMYVTYII